MKVLIVVPSFHNGGTITSLKNILSRIDRNLCSIDVFPITNSGPNYRAIKQYANVIGTYIDEGDSKQSFKTFIKSEIFIIVKTIKKALCILGYDPSIVFFKRVIPNLQKNRYDEVIAFQEGQATRFVSLFKDVRKVAWVRCDYSKIGKDSLKKDQKLHVYDSFDQIICVSEYTKNQFVRIVPGTANKTVGLHNLIPVKRIKENADYVIDDCLFTECKSLRFVSLGRLHPVKQFSKIPEIANQLRRRGLSFCWFIIGGDESDTPIILKNINNCQVTECVKLLGNKNNPYPYIKKADLLICTSLSEACPNVINEAKILGTPIASTNFGSVSEMMSNGKEGLVAPIECLGDVIFQLCTDKKLYSHIKNEVSNYRYDNSLILDTIQKMTSLRFIDCE